MAVTTGIAWCDHTWSPWRGCTKVSEGCRNCYAEALSHRNPAVLGEWGPNGTRVVNKDWDAPRRWDRAAAKAGVRRRVFPSLCDPFEDREDLVNLRIRFFELVDRTPNLDWLVLTKRPEVAREWAESSRMMGLWAPPPNLWLGVSVEDQPNANRRIPELLRIPAAVRWLSVEPLLGPIDLTRIACVHDAANTFDCLNPFEGDPICRRDSGPAIGWVVVGGESGPDHRPCEVAWIRSIADQCREAGVPLFVKQDSGRFPGSQGRIPDDLWTTKEFPSQGVG